MKYHLSCPVKQNRNAEKIQDDCINELNMAQMVSDIELIDVVNRTLSESKLHTWIYYVKIQSKL